MAERQFFLKLCFAINFWGMAALAQVIPIAREGNAYHAALDVAVPHPVELSACIFETIGFVEKAELTYLVGLTPGMIITAADLKKAALCLQVKRAFAVIELGIESIEQGKIRVRWHLERDWLINKVKTHGGIVGKQAYRALYTMEPGDPFDQQKHEASLLSITEAFKRDGYERARVTSRLVRDYAHMAITVHLNFIRGPRTKKAVPISVVVPEGKGVVRSLWEFKGNCFFSYDQLVALVDAFGESALRLPASIIADEIERVYRARGFWAVHIEYENKGAHTLFTLREGDRARLDGIDMQVSLKDATDLIAEHFSNVLADLFIDEEKIAEALDHLIGQYVQEGFFDARIVKQQYVEKSPGVYRLSLVLDEGRQSYFEQVRVPAYEDLEKIIPSADEILRGNVPCTTARIKAQQQWLTDHFKALGYESPDIKYDINRRNEKVIIIWRVNPGKEVHFGKTIVLGNGTLPIHYILRELAYTPSDRFDTQAIKTSMMRLKELELFDCIRISPCYIEQADPQERLMIARVYSDMRCDLRARAGFGLQQFTRQFSFAGITYNIGATILIKNPFSIADRICIDAESAFGYRNFAISYRMPWLANLPIRTLIQGYTTRYQYPGITDCPQPLYEVDQGGVLIGLAKKYYAYDAAVTAGVERMHLSIDKVCCPGTAQRDELVHALCINPLLLDNPTTYAQAEPTVFIDYLDNRMQPTRGSLTMLSTKVMIPCRAEDARQWLAKVVVDESFFVPLRPFVFAGRIRLGHIFHARLPNCMPTERFYLGGANSVRSYATDMAPPLGTFYDSCGNKHLVARGGTSLLTFNAELRFPLYKKMSGAIFQDLGYLWTAGGGPGESKPLMGTGFGLRYATPIGPLRFDIAWQWWDACPGLPRYAWFLTFGHAF